MVEYEGALIDLEPGAAWTPDGMPVLRSKSSIEFETINVDAIYITVACEADVQDLLSASVLLVPKVNSMVGATPFDVLSGAISHDKIDHLRSWESVTLLTLYGLPASEFGYVRAITITRLGRPVPFLTTVLDSDLPTGLITSVAGKSSTVVQKLKYIVRGQRPHEEFESDEIDLSGAVPPSIEVTIRRKRSAQLNRKKMR